MGFREEAFAALEQSRQDIRQYALNQSARQFALVETTSHSEPKQVVAWGVELENITKLFFSDGDWGTYDSAERARDRLARHMFVELVYL